MQSKSFLHFLNDVGKRAFDIAGFPSILEPADLPREDGKRPGGAILYPYSSEKCVVCDATLVDTLASSNLIKSALHSGQAAADVEGRISSKYMGTSNTYKVQPVVFDTSGACGSDTQFFTQSRSNSC